MPDLALVVRAGRVVDLLRPGPGEVILLLRVRLTWMINLPRPEGDVSVLFKVLRNPDQARQSLPESLAVSVVVAPGDKPSILIGDYKRIFQCMKPPLIGPFRGWKPTILMP